MQHMVFGLSWPLLATNCYRRRTGIEYILHHILQPCRQTIASVQFKTWCIIIFMATPPPSGKYPARQKLPNQLPTFALRHALVSLEEPTNGDVWCNLNAVLSKKRCFRNRVFTHYGLKAYKYKVINMFVKSEEVCLIANLLQCSNIAFLLLQSSLQDPNFATPKYACLSSSWRAIHLAQNTCCILLLWPMMWNFMKSFLYLRIFDRSDLSSKSCDSVHVRST